jgi:hypothetical protein
MNMAPKKPKLDPNGKYLIQDGSNHIFVHSDKLALRKDMRPYDPKAGKVAVEPAPVTKGLVEIELQGKSFMVEQALYDLLAEMGEKWTEMQEAVKTLNAEKTDFEAVKERLTTDVADLTEQLKAAQEKIAELSKPVEGPTEEPKKKGK